MNQPARSQEPSMEEILASIRRIIADDDASKTAQRPPDAPRPEAPPLPPLPPLQEIPDVFAAPPPPPPPAPPPPAPRIEFEPPPPPPPVVEEPVAFRQETVADQSADILDLTESMAAALDSSPPVPQFRTIDGSSDVGFDEAQESTELPPPSPPDMPSYASFPPSAPRLHDDQGRLISGATSAAVDFGLQCARADRAVAKRPYARRPGARDAAPDVEVVARRQSARHGRAHGPCRDRTRVAGPAGLVGRRTIHNACAGAMDSGLLASRRSRMTKIILSAPPQAAPLGRPRPPDLPSRSQAVSTARLPCVG